jgi:hypothetical protein
MYKVACNLKNTEISGPNIVLKKASELVSLKYIELKDLHSISISISIYIFIIL